MTRPAAGGHFRVAVALLTRFPVGRNGTDPDDDWRAARAFFPAVGALVAGAGIVVRAAAAPLLGAGPATVLSVGAMVLATGAFHEDGLADSADGLWGGQTPERRLAIMHDSRIGTFGVVALVLVLALRFALLAPLALADFSKTVLAAHVLGRAAGVAVTATLPAAGAGLGSRVTGPARWTTVCAVTLGALVAGACAASRWFWAPVVAALVAAAAARSLVRRRIGCINGDLIGASILVAEVTVMAVVVGLLRHGIG